MGEDTKIEEEDRQFGGYNGTIVNEFEGHKDLAAASIEPTLASRSQLQLTVDM